MKHFTKALQGVVDRSFDGNYAAMEQVTGVDRSVISRLARGKFAPSIERLEELAEKLAGPDREAILLAAARDQVPLKWQASLFGEVGALARLKLPPDIAEIIIRLEELAMTDPETQTYLRGLSGLVKRR